MAGFKAYSLRSDPESPLQGFSVQLEAQWDIFIKIWLPSELGFIVVCD